MNRDLQNETDTSAHSPQGIAPLPCHRSFHIDKSPCQKQHAPSHGTTDRSPCGPPAFMILPTTQTPRASLRSRDAADQGRGGAQPRLGDPGHHHVARTWITAPPCWTCNVGGVDGNRKEREALTFLREIEGIQFSVCDNARTWLAHHRSRTPWLPCSVHVRYSGLCFEGSFTGRYLGKHGLSERAESQVSDCQSPLVVKARSS